MHVPDIQLVAVMGVTGSGKSNFLRLVLGENAHRVPVVESDLESCTQKTEAYECVVNGKQIVFFDTPGFDDTHRGDADILADIAQNLSVSYKSKLRLTGILYLQRIKDERMTNALLRNITMLKSLCGDDAFGNIILVTTFWDELPDVRKGEAREKQLLERPDWWGYMASCGSKVQRFANTRASALNIVGDLLGLPPVKLQIQQEMVDQGKAVDKTTAGEELNRELARLKTQFEADLETFRQQEREAHDEKLKQVMHDMRTEKEAFVRRVEEEQEALRSDRREEQRLLEQKFHDHMIRLRREQRAREYKIEELENTLRQERNVVDGRFQRVLDESSAKIEELRRSIAAARMQDC